MGSRSLPRNGRGQEFIFDGADDIAEGYGDGVEVNNCPNTVVMAMLLLIGPFYEHREDASWGRG